MDKLKRYLRPNFSQHPMNSLIAVLVFFGAFSVTAVVGATEEHYEAGYFWYMSGSTTYRNTPQGVLAWYVQYQSNPAEWSVSSYSGTDWRLKENGVWKSYVYRSECNGSHVGATYCQASPPECNQGDQATVTREISPPRNIGDELVIAIRGGTDGTGDRYMFHGGCQYTRSASTVTETSTFRPLDKEMAGTYETATWTATGETAPENFVGEPSWSEGDAEMPALVPEISDLSDDASTVVGPETETQVGTDTVKDQTTIDTEVKDKGTTVTETSDSVTTDFSQGIQKTVTTNTKTIEHADGTVTEIVTTETEYTQKPGEKITYDKETGQLTITDHWTGGTSETEVKTTEKDGQGNVTGTSTTKTGSSTGGSAAGTGSTDGTGDEPGDDFCTQNPSHPDCGEVDAEGAPDDGLYQPGDLTYGDVFGKFKDTVTGSGIVAAGTGFFDLSLSAGSCPVWSANTEMFGAITIDHLCSPVMDFAWPIVAAVLLAIFSYLAFRVAVL